MKKLNIILLMFLIPALGFGQLYTRKEIKIPDIPGYLTLKCDLHMHTVFSDGNVWPTVRADEAWREGLDVFAISDHVEYQPHKEDITTGIGRSYEIAKPRADELGLMIIRAAEITRDMPPGHFNVLFLDSISALYKDNFWQAIQAAVDQDAFIFWNHPGWRQPDEIPIWYDEHSRLYDEGHMHGMEIVNERSYYPLAHQWCLEKNITMLGNSDIHNPTGMDIDFAEGAHRAITLVFAEKFTEESVKEALVKGRTAVYYKDMLMGKQEFLKPIFEKSVNIANRSVELGPGETFNLQVTNNSEVPFILEAAEGEKDIFYQENVTLYPGRTSIIRIRSKQIAEPGIHTYTLRFVVSNLLTGVETGLPVELKFKAKIVD
ncbi:MAG: histidinol-phosphatase [Bacteroidales bacterium]|nr:histidinol-phosphatase [Bacteroidales bacterium]